MFTGEFQHTIDQKNRIVIPSKFRVFIGDESDKKGFFVGVNLGGDEKYLNMYTYRGWLQVVESVRRRLATLESGDDYLRVFSSSAEFAAIDKQSRLVIPQRLIDAVGVGRDVVLVGRLERIEIWSVADWKEKQSLMEKSYAEMKEIFKKHPQVDFPTNVS